MANCLFAFPNFLEPDPEFATVSFDGGMWRPSLPLSNLADPDLAKVARSVNASLDSTRFTVDLGVMRDVRAVILPNARVSRDATCQVKGYSDAALTSLVCDSGVKPWYQAVYPFGSLPWGHPSWWDGKLSAEEAKGFPIPWIQVWPTEQNFRYLTVQIDDQNSSLGYVDLPRLFAARAWQPSLNLINGASGGWINNSTMKEAPGGKRFYTVRRPRRGLQFEFDYLPQDEALARGSDFGFRAGISNQFFWIFDPDDVAHLHRRSYLATLRQPPTEKYTDAHLRVGLTYSIEEVNA